MIETIIVISIENRNMKTARVYAILLISSIVLTFVASCSDKSISNQSVSVCLSSKLDMDNFLQEIRHIATDENMVISDRSEATAREIQMMGNDEKNLRRGRIINLSAENPSGDGFSISDLGKEYQVAIGFRIRKNSQESYRIYDRITTRIKNIWPVVVSETRGASVIDECVVAG